MRYFQKVIFILIALIIQSCASDLKKNLGQGYFFRDEGGTIKDILCERSDGCEIPSTITFYDYNAEFIIAEQRPNLPQDPLYNGTYVYKKGINQTYYWLIIKKLDKQFGPITESELIQLMIQYKVPDKLKKT
jgi:hypothetical protein